MGKYEEYVQRLFVTANGNPIENGGKYIRNFFKKYNLHITTNSLRSLFENETNKAYKSGIITLADKESVHMVNGHTGKTSKDFYMHDQRVDDGLKALEVTQTLFMPTDSSFVSSTPVVEKDTSALQSPVLLNGADQWGHSRADYNTPGLKKAEWTHDEKCMIGDFCVGEMFKYRNSPVELVSAEQNLVSNCLAYIK